MAQSRAVRESALGECFVADAGASLERTGTASFFGGGVMAAFEEACRISSNGFTLESILGSFAISSGFDKREERISPPPVFP